MPEKETGNMNQFIEENGGCIMKVNGQGENIGGGW